MDYIRNLKDIFIPRPLPAPDPEGGVEPDALPAGHYRASIKNVPDKRRQTVVAVENKLVLFRFLIGITTNPSMERRSRIKGKPVVEDQSRGKIDRRGSNKGIYAHVVRNEEREAGRFKWFSRLLNGCLGTQIVVAAALTALGAGGASHTTITVFGAINTVIAGFLTYLKGSGLPNRLKFYQIQWRELRDYIEQKERELTRSDCKLDVNKVVKDIVEKYEQVRADIEANTPDSYTSIGDMSRRDDRRKAQAQPDLDANSETDELASDEKSAVSGSRNDSQPTTKSSSGDVIEPESGTVTTGNKLSVSQNEQSVRFSSQVSYGQSSEEVETPPASTEQTNATHLLPAFDPTVSPKTSMHPEPLG